MDCLDNSLYQFHQAIGTYLLFKVKFPTLIVMPVQLVTISVNQVAGNVETDLGWGREAGGAQGHMQ